MLCDQLFSKDTNRRILSFHDKIFPVTFCALLVDPGSTAVLCDTYQHKIMASSHGFIQSPNYPSTSPNFRGPPCTVTLISQSPTSVKVEVDGRFYIPPNYGNNKRCCHQSHSSTCLAVFDNAISSSACGNWNDDTGQWIINDSAKNGSTLIDIAVSFTSIYDTFSFRLRYTGK